MLEGGRESVFGDVGSVDEEIFIDKKRRLSLEIAV